MPPQPLFQVPEYDPDKVVVDHEGIYRVIPHRFEFEQLGGLLLYDDVNMRIAAYRDVREDEFWVRGHIPGRPLLPGALIIETAAQMVAYFATRLHPDRGFVGFGGVDKVKFRGQVVPGQRMVLIGSIAEMRSRRCAGDTQAFVDGRMVFEGRIGGVWV